MASAPTLDLEQLIAPISDAEPGGTNVRVTKRDLFQRAKDARTNAVAAERKQRDLAFYSAEDLAQLPDQDRVVGAPNWALVRDLCVETLSSYSKDLWIASWLIEASTRLDGFAGLRDCFHLVTELADRFWEHISPPPDEEEGYLYTVSQLASLNGLDSTGILIFPIESIPLLPRYTGYSFSALRHAQSSSSAKPNEAEFFSAVRELVPQQLRDQAEDIVQAIESFGRMSDLLDQKCGTHDGVPVAPGSSAILKTLTQCQDAFRLLSKDVSAAGLSSQAAASDNEELAAAVTGGSTGIHAASMQVNNREEAFRLLLRTSEFFRKTEPHSPVGYMLQKAVRIGRMDLPDLMREMINDNEVLVRFAERTGIDIKTDRDDD